MKWIWVAVAVLSRFEGVLGVTDNFLTALTPHAAIECSQTNFTWFGGTPPYAISLLANDTNGYRALGFANIQTTSFITKLPFAAGQWLEFLIRDAKGGQAVSSPFHVTSTNDSSGSCALIATPLNKDSITGNSTLKLTSPTSLDSISVCDSSFTVNWQGGQPPYDLLLQTLNTSVLMEQAFGGPMMDGGSINTRVQIPAGQTFQVIVADSAGTFATTGQITLASGGESDCVITSDATSAAGVAGSSFRVSGSANASAILLPTPSQHTFLSATPGPSLAADLKPKNNSSSTKTVAIIASLLSVAFVGLLVALFVFYRSHIRKRGKRTIDLLGEKGMRSSRVPPIPVADMESYRPEPYYLPAVPQRGAVAPERALPEPSQSFYPTYAAPVREYFGAQQPVTRVVANPDFERSPTPPYSAPRYSDEHHEYDGYDDEKKDPFKNPFSPTHTTYEVDGLTWEDEKPMLR